jgi:hypothetical protein
MSDIPAVPGDIGRLLAADIQRTLDQLGKVDYAAVLRQHFPPRPTAPREYRRMYSERPRVQCLYVGPRDSVSGHVPPGFDLLALFGVGFTRRETEEVVELLEKQQFGPRVLVGIPLQALPGSAQFKELAALDRLAGEAPYAEEGPARQALLHRREALRKSLRERLRQELRPRGFRWLRQGQLVEEAPAGTRDTFFTHALETIYPACPRVRTVGSRREIREALDELLDLANPLKLPSHSRKGATRVLRRLLVDTGILVPVEDCGSYVRCSVQGALPEDSPLGRAWNLVLEKLVGTGDQNRRQGMADLLRWMEMPPLGMRGPLRMLLIAAAMRRHHPDLELLMDGEPLPVSGVSLRQAMARPSRWEVYYHPAAANEEAFLTSLRQIFGEPAAQAVPGGPNAWARAMQALRAWHEALPPVARASTGHLSREAAGLLASLSDPARTDNARDFLAVDLPEIFGEPGIPLEEEQAELLRRIEQARQEIEATPGLRRDQLTAEICRLFGGEGLSGQEAREWLTRHVARWLEGLDLGAAEGFSELAQGLLAALAEPRSFDERWFEVLPTRLGLPPVQQWEPDRGPIFLARLSRARMELELWRIRELLPLPEDPGQRRDKVRAWVREALAAGRLDPRQQESVLLDLLEAAVWDPERALS